MLLLISSVVYQKCNSSQTIMLHLRFVKALTKLMLVHVIPLNDLLLATIKDDPNIHCKDYD